MSGLDVDEWLGTSGASWVAWEVGDSDARSSETVILETVISLDGVGVSVTVTCDSRPSWSISVIDSVFVALALLTASAIA